MNKPKILAIQLNQDYKSFKNGFNYSFSGDLIILSGVNGSGKSQLVDIISQREGYGSKKPISAIITLNDRQIARDDILRRSFKENVNVPELTYAGTETVRSHKDQVWNAYNNYRLDHNNENLWDYKESCEKSKKILIEEFGEEKFNSGRITQTDLRDKLPADFVWKSDDVFTNFIGELFFNYAVDVNDAEAEAGRSGNKFDPSSLPTPPWKQLNSLFLDLGFEYRFKENFFVKSLQINEQPNLYQVKGDGTIDENEQRKLADLSDGEKAIISLSFASLSGVKEDDRKILLLDEFDANFNPSLTEVFYKIIDKYFTSQGILVIVATHSPTTISLAPEGASFYEAFKPNTGSSRILPVQKGDYDELKIANKGFYSKIADQAKRITELEKEKTELNLLLQLTKPSLFVEGPTDIQYLNKASEFYPEWKEILNSMNIEEKNGNELHKYRKNKSYIKEFLHQPLVLLFDCDTKLENIDEPPVYIRCIPFLKENSIKKGIENLLSDNLILKAEKAEGKKFTQKSIPNADEKDKEEWTVVDNEKKNLANWICSNAGKEDFSNFKLIFDMIQAIIKK